MSLILVFEDFEIVFWIRFLLLGGLFHKTFLIWGFLDDFIQSSGIIFLVPFLATKVTLTPLANDPIMKRLIQLFRQLEHQNPSIISDSICRNRMLRENRKILFIPLITDISYLQYDSLTEIHYIYHTFTLLQ